MVEVTRSFTVDPAPAVVVDFLKDFGRAEEWDPGTKTCTRKDPGPVAVGSSWHNVSEFRGRETELEYELRELAVDRLVFVGTNKTVTSTDDIGVQGHHAGSEITYHATLDFHGLAKLAGPLLQHSFEKVADDTVLQMTQVLNALPG
ncbi:MAG: SRPBCC family protein [Actinomycetota bacterium]|nr:SRPBCC family protein [Actinomycetota bacterium]